MKQNKSIAQNYGYNLIYQILILILPLITTPYISRVLGAEAIGIYSYTLSIVTYFILFGSLGIAMYGQREIAYCQEDKKNRSKTFIEIATLKVVTMLIAMVVFYMIYINGTQYQMYYKIFLLELIANCFDISWFFQGIEEFKRTVTRNIIVKLISVILIFALVKTTNDLSIYIFIYVLSTLIGNLSLWFYLPKYIEKVDKKELKIFKHLKPTIALFIPQIAIQIYTVLDKTMIGQIILDKSEVGYYEQAQKVIKILLTIVTSLGTVMLPRMANTFANGEKEKLRNYMKNSFNFVFFLAFPILFGVLGVSSNFVPIFFGKGYDKVIVLMNVISPILLMIGMSNIMGMQYLMPTKKTREFTISVTLGAIINFLLNLLLIRNHMSIGASIATVIAEATVTGMQIYFMRKEFKMREFLKLAKNYFLGGLLMFAVVVLIRNITVSIFYNLVLQIFVGIVAYFLFLIIIKDKLIIQVKEKIREKLLKKSKI